MEVESDEEEQENDADLGEVLHRLVVRDDVQPGRSEDYAEQKIGDDGGLAEFLQQPDQERRGGGDHGYGAERVKLHAALILCVRGPGGGQGGSPTPSRSAGARTAV